MNRKKKWISFLLCAAIFCLLAGCSQSNYPAQTVRMYSMLSQELDNHVTVVQSEQDLETFTQFLNEKLNEQVQQTQSENYDMLKNTTYASATEKYNANFFTDRALLMVLKMGFALDEYVVTKVEVNNNQGEICLQESKTEGIPYDDIMLQDVVIIEIPHDLIADSYTVTVEE